MMAVSDVLPFIRRPRWLAFHALCLTAVVLMVSLSMWQFRRLDERQDFNSLVRTRSVEAVVPVEELDLTDPGSVSWRRVGLAGTYQTSGTVVILNRSQGGRAGVNVVTPLRLESGESILVVRGFLALDAPVPEPPSGPVRVVGTVRVAEVRRAGQPTESLEATDEFFRLDIERISAAIDLELLPVAVTLDISDPVDDGSLQPVAAPELSDGPHLSYAIQWLIFAVAVVIGWGLAVRRSYVMLPR